MDLCFMILSNPAITDVAQRKLQGRAMECGTLLGRCHTLAAHVFLADPNGAGIAVGKNVSGSP